MDNDNMILMDDEELTPVDKLAPNKHLWQLGPVTTAEEERDAIRYLRDELEGLSTQAQIRDLGDLSGHTLVVSIPTKWSVRENVERVNEILHKVVPDDCKVVVVTHDVHFDIMSN